MRLEVTQDAARGRVGEADLLDEEQMAHGPPDSAALRRTDRDGSDASCGAESRHYEAW